MKDFICIDNLPYKTILIEIDLKKMIAECFTDNGETFCINIQFNDSTVLQEL
jgi:hypothetical protein